VRQHLKVDARFIHFFQTQFAEIVEPPDDLRSGARAAERLHLGIEVVFLERNDRGFCRHTLPPHYSSGV